MRPRIKICGIGSERDALAAARLGVDAVGFVLAPSPRRVAPERVREICLALPPFVSRVGVFVNEGAMVVRQTVEFCGLDWVQLHGDESPDYCERLGLPILKAVRVRDQASVDGLAPYGRFVRGFVLDAYVSGKAGGTGKTFDWGLAEGAGAHGPIILSGGLSPENVAQAVEQVRPYGVDVSSGVEFTPGVKDHDKMQRFVERIGKVS